MGFSRQKHWLGLPRPPNPGKEPGSLALQAYSFPSEPSGKPNGCQNILPQRAHRQDGTGFGLTAPSLWCLSALTTAFHKHYITVWKWFVKFICLWLQKIIFGERDLRLTHLFIMCLYKERIQYIVVQWIKELCQLCEPLHSLLLLKGKSSQKPQGAEGSPDLELDHGWQRHALVLAHGRCDDSAMNLSHPIWTRPETLSQHSFPGSHPRQWVGWHPDAGERYSRTRWQMYECDLTNTEMRERMLRQSAYCSFKMQRATLQQCGRDHFNSANNGPARLGGCGHGSCPRSTWFP